MSSIPMLSRQWPPLGPDLRDNFIFNIHQKITPPYELVSLNSIDGGKYMLLEI